MVQPVSTISVGELCAFVKRQFGDESGVQISDSDIIRWVNMGAIEIVAKNSVNQATATTTGVIGTGSYDLSDFLTDVIRIEDVSYDGVTLEPTDKSGLRKLVKTQEVESGAPIYWYTWANSIKFWPVPSAAGAISIDYIKKPPNVLTTADFLPVPDVFYERLCNFVLSKAYELDEDVEKSTDQRQLFENKLTEMSGLTTTMAGSFPVIRDDFESGYFGGNEWW